MLSPGDNGPVTQTISTAGKSTAANQGAGTQVEQTPTAAAPTLPVPATPTVPVPPSPTVVVPQAPAVPTQGPAPPGPISPPTVPVAPAAPELPPVPAPITFSVDMGFVNTGFQDTVLGPLPFDLDPGVEDEALRRAVPHPAPRSPLFEGARRVGSRSDSPATPSKTDRWHAAEAPRAQRARPARRPASLPGELPPLLLAFGFLDTPFSPDRNQRPSSGGAGIVDLPAAFALAVPNEARVVPDDETSPPRRPRSRPLEHPG